jgi:hypothetical protein
MSGDNSTLLIKTTDISQTPLVRRYGARGAKLFARIWFSLLYVFLIGLTATLPVVGPELAAGWRRIFVGCLAGGLVVFAASLLTRMRLEYFAAIERLEIQGKAV